MSQYSKSEEIANSITHGLGIVFAIGGLTALMVLTSYFGSATHLVSYLIYGISMLVLYTASTLYHSIPSERAKKFLKICDHAAIYLLIAGTYTPFLLINLKGNLSYIAIGIIWAIAIAGVVFKVFFTGKFERLSTILYLAMGWMVIFVAEPLFNELNAQAITWLVAGGMAYTLGTIFYMMKKQFAHAIWHVFVLLGSIFHFTAIIYAAGFQF
ncbi:MAG: hemolysin III family protein [Bacteriovoracaceae bacterium]|nr:hemolysin III family protein [Bacteriovoracaceae bacterium]